MKSLSYFLDTCPKHIKDKFVDMNFNTLDKVLIKNEVCYSV